MGMRGLHNGRVPGRRRAFTLIELLAVIAIIAVLAALLLPVVQSAMAKGRATKCQSHLKEIGVGVLMYVQDNDGMMPPKDPPSYPVKDVNGQVTLMAYPKFSDFIHSYIQRKDGKATVWFCPTDNRNVDMSYGININVLGTSSYISYTNGAVYPWSLARRPGEIILLADSAWSSYAQREIYWGDGYPVKNFNVEFRHPYSRANTTVAPASLSDFPTNSRANFLFHDGHVEARLPGSLTNGNYYNTTRL